MSLPCACRYTRDALLSARSMDLPILRSVRKILFYNGLWQPATRRFINNSVMSPFYGFTDTDFVCDPNRIIVGYINAQSIGNKSVLLQNAIVEHRLDVFSVVETWHETPDDLALQRITPDGFQCFDLPRPRGEHRDQACKRKAAGGGIALIVRDGFRCNILNFDFKARTYEFLAVMLTHNGVRTAVVTVYRPNNKDSAVFYDEFTRLLEFVVVLNCNILLLGDINIHIDVVNDAARAKFISILDCFGLQQLIEQSTHRAGHTLDVILVKSEQASLVRTLVFPPTISDHSLIVTSHPLTKPCPVPFSVTTRAWKNFNREDFSKELAKSALCSSIDVLRDKSVDDLAEIYSSTLSSLIDRFAPRFGVNRHYRPITPWYNAACRAQKRRVQCLERVYRRSHSSADRERWLSQRLSCQDFYKQTQNTYWHTIITNSSGNARKLWNVLSSVMGKRRTTPSHDNLSAELFLK